MRQLIIHGPVTIIPGISGGKMITYFHETYHVEQTEQLRQLAGKNDKVI